MPITKGKGKKDGLQQYRVRVNYTDASKYASPVYVRCATQRRHDGIRTV